LNLQRSRIVFSVEMRVRSKANQIASKARPAEAIVGKEEARSLEGRWGLGLRRFEKYNVRCNLERASPVSATEDDWRRDAGLLNQFVPFSEMTEAFPKARCIYPQRRHKVLTACASSSNGLATSFGKLIRRRVIDVVGHWKESLKRRVS
jgi:hypothetical protein